jgi:hypothetical protein
MKEYGAATCYKCISCPGCVVGNLTGITNRRLEEVKTCLARDVKLHNS